MHGLNPNSLHAGPPRQRCSHLETVTAVCCYPMHSHKESAVLILTRMEGEKIVIADDITITVVGINESQVRLGFDAPRDVRVMRAELLDRDSEDR